MRFRVQWLLEPGHVTSIPSIVASSTPTFPHLALGEGRSGDRSHKKFQPPAHPEEHQYICPHRLAETPRSHGPPWECRPARNRTVIRPILALGLRRESHRESWELEIVYSSMIHSRLIVCRGTAMNLLISLLPGTPFPESQSPSNKTKLSGSDGSAESWQTMA